MKQFRRLLRQLTTPPNLLTLSRIALTPWIIYAIAISDWRMAGYLFVLAALTDLFDGPVARLMKYPTALGRLLDPLADKIMLTATLIALAWFHAHSIGIPLWFVILQIGREVLLVGGSCVLLMFAPHIQLRANVAGKANTAAHIVCIGALMMAYAAGWPPEAFARPAIWLLAISSVISCAWYVVLASSLLSRREACLRTK